MSGVRVCKQSPQQAVKVSTLSELSQLHSPPPARLFNSFRPFHYGDFQHRGSIERLSSDTHVYAQLLCLGGAFD